MARDGTNRGGRRVRAGDKPAPAAEKIQKGQQVQILNNDIPTLSPTELEAVDLPEGAVMNGVDMPKPSDYLSARQKNGVPLGADEIYKETWLWLKKRNCEKLVNPRLIEAYAQYETDAYMLAMLLACTAVWCTEKLPRVWGMICAAGCLCVSLALYQSYIQFAVGLYLLVLLQRALQDTAWRIWLQQGLRALAALALGAVIYVVSLKISLALTGYQLADTGNGLAQMLRLGPAAVLTAIPAAYADFLKTLLGYSSWNDRGMRMATALLLAMTAAGLLVKLRGCNKRTIVQAVAVVLLLPIGLNVSYLLASGNVYILMQHALFLVYLLPMIFFGWRSCCRCCHRKSG